jgi:hypothetical protein
MVSIARASAAVCWVRTRSCCPMACRVSPRPLSASALPKPVAGLAEERERSPVVVGGLAGPPLPPVDDGELVQSVSFADPVAGLAVESR